MFVQQIERAGRPVRRRNTAAVAFAVALGLSVVGPSTLWADPAGMTAAGMVRIPEREVDLEASQAHRDATRAARREVSHARIRVQDAPPSASTAASAAALEPDAHENQLQGVPLE
jgi:hypothetical protein